MRSKKAIEWRKIHLKNLIWSAKRKDGLYTEKDVKRFEKELMEL